MKELDYKFEFDKKRNQFEVWRKNPKGFFNFVSYADKEEDIKKIIENDKKKQNEEPKKFKKKIEEDDV